MSFIVAPGDKGGFNEHHIESLSSKMCKFFYGRLLSAIIFMINQTEALHQWDLSRLFYEYNDQLNPQESGYLL